MKEYQRSIKRSVRDLDRELNTLKRSEAKLMNDIKKAAKDGRVDSAKIMAKDLVRTRKFQQKMWKMKSHMEAVSLRLTTMNSTTQMAQCMKGVTKVMGKMNAKMNMPQINKIMMEFEKQNEMMGAKEEMMDDAMDDAFADDEDEEEEEMVVGQVMAELGVQLAGAVPSAGVSTMEAGASGAEAGAAAQAQPAAASGGGDGGAGGGDANDLDAELQRRLDNLRRT